MAAGVTVAGILTLAVLTMALQQEVFAQAYNQGSSYDKNNKQENKEIAVGGNRGSGGAGGAGGEGGQGGKNVAEDNGKTSCCKGDNTKIDQKANGGDANGGRGGNANGGDAST